MRVTLDELLRAADVLSLHCPLTPATTGLIGKRELALMKPDALLINTARGALVDLEALVAALKGGDLGGAAIDVLPQEPPLNGSPAVRARHSEPLVTPHIAWAAFEARQRAVDRTGAQYRRFPARRTARASGLRSIWCRCAQRSTFHNRGDARHDELFRAALEFAPAQFVMLGSAELGIHG